MPKLAMFFPLTKVDEAKRLVYGIATAEQVDKSGEKCDYATTVPYYKAWSAGIQKASGGKSLGNVRAMHGNVVAGVLKELNFNDDDRQIEICAKIVDDAEWKKVLEGAYTGFSQGGSYAKTWKDPQDPTVTIYTADPAEVSIVDNCCLAAAAFTLIRSDGATEMRKFDTSKIAAKKVEQRWTATDGFSSLSKDAVIVHQANIDADELAAPALKAAAEIQDRLDKSAPMYWDTEEFIEEHFEKGTIIKVKDLKDPKPEISLFKRDFSHEKRKELAQTGAAMSDGSYPIENGKDVENAVKDWARTGKDSGVKAHIKERAKAVGAEDKLPDHFKEKAKKFALSNDEGKAALEALHKFSIGEIHDAKQALHHICEIGWLIAREESEVEYQDSEEKAQVVMLQEAIEKLRLFAISELEEAADEPDDELEMAETIIVLAAAAGVDAEMLKANAPLMEKLSKRGRHSKADAERISEMHDHVETMGDHVEKLGKMHKSMEETHEEAGENSHAEHHGEMGRHIKKLGKHVEKMEGVHKDMEMCMKCLGVGKEGEGGQNGRTPNDPQKAEMVEALQKSNADADALRCMVTKLSDTLEAVNKRLADVESQPAIGGTKPAVFAVQKSHEVPNPGAEEPVEASSPNVFGSGMSPEQARRSR